MCHNYIDIGTGISIMGTVISIILAIKTFHMHAPTYKTLTFFS